MTRHDESRLGVAKLGHGRDRASGVGLSEARRCTEGEKKGGEAPQTRDVGGEG
jgi:hypothetical protein